MGNFFLEHEPGGGGGETMALSSQTTFSRLSKAKRRCLALLQGPVLELIPGRCSIILLYCCWKFWGDGTFCFKSIWQQWRRAEKCILGCFLQPRTLARTKTPECVSLLKVWLYHPLLWHLINFSSLCVVFRLLTSVLAKGKELCSCALWR